MVHRQRLEQPSAEHQLSMDTPTGLTLTHQRDEERLTQPLNHISIGHTATLTHRLKTITTTSALEFID